MKSIFFKIKIVLLSVMFLLASNSYAITSHFCGLEKDKISNSSCCTKIIENDCTLKKNTNKDCCKDIVEIIVPTTIDNVVNVKISLEQQQFILTFLDSYKTLFQEKLKETAFSKKIYLSDIEHNYQVLYQSFLI